MSQVICLLTFSPLYDIIISSIEDSFVLHFFPFLCGGRVNYLFAAFFVFGFVYLCPSALLLLLCGICQVTPAGQNNTVLILCYLSAVALAKAESVFVCVHSWLNYFFAMN
jgi:hypothetical protein